ncbi:hypothetical protein [Carboxydothermus pertinax]|uniref:Preprotein translocase subunit SecB n=1 Tax=Carboxydothermus pertinax TaxID=870242 RepID=A0A1L8CWL6_9THEO|nr:hypothetical protein [Carboxydothermus pertinax]GAV23293.1 hypothetical protein cpu_18030 [Carboxydothermus pertinax]
MSKLKYSLRTIKIQEINAYLTKETNENSKGSKKFSLKREKPSINIEVLSDKKFIVKVSEKISFVPDLLAFKLEVIGYYSANALVNEEELEKDKNYLAEPLFPFISLVVGFITEKMLNGPPLILPPFNPYEEDDNENSPD